MPELSQRLKETKEGLDEEKKKKLQKWKRELIDTVEHEDEQMVAKRLENAHILQLVEDDFYEELITLAEKDIVRSYLETNRERIMDELPSTTDDSFDVKRYEGLNKTELAREMARHCVKGKNIIPVDYGEGHDQETKFFKYDRSEGLYKPYSQNKLTTLCTKMAGKEDSQHLENEFKRNMRNQQMRKPIDGVGLPSNKILLNNRKVLDISNPEEPEVSTVSPDDYAIHKIDVTYSPEEDCPNFVQFVEQLLDEDEEAIKTLQEFMGWLLKFPDNTFQKALLILGESNTGKSQLTELLEEMFSDSSVTNLSMRMVGMERTFHLSNLRESILNIDRDLASQTIESPDYVKQTISQEKIQVEDKGSSAYKVQPTAKHVICSNVSPRIENTDDDGFYSRFITLKAPNVVERKKRVPNLGQKLYEREAPGILNWMLEGLCRLKEQGQFTLTREPYETKNLWNQYGNSAQKFIWYRCEATGSDDDFMSVDRLYEEYEVWVSSRLEERIKKYEFKQTMLEQPLFVEGKGYEDGQQKRGIRGIKVPDVEE